MSGAEERAVEVAREMPAYDRDALLWLPADGHFSAAQHKSMRRILLELSEARELVISDDSMHDDETVFRLTPLGQSVRAILAAEVSP